MTIRVRSCLDMTSRNLLPLVTFVFICDALITQGSAQPEPSSGSPGGLSDQGWSSQPAGKTPGEGRDPALPADTLPCQIHSGSERGPPLPSLDLQFEARVEAKILQKDYTVEVVEHYDYINNRGVVRRMKDGVQSTWLYDFKQYQSFLIKGSDCWLSDMRREGFQFFNFTTGKDGGHIGGATDLFNFGTRYNETFVSGEERIRGIPVNRWTACVEWKRYKAVFQIDYYFSKPNYTTSLGKREVPVRAILRGQAVNSQEGEHAFHHIYDFVFYRPGPIADPSVFEVPHNAICHRKLPQKRRPVLPDSFQMEVQIVHPQDNYYSGRKYYYDMPRKLSRYDFHPSLKTISAWGIRFGYTPLTLIHDYNTGLQYVLDWQQENCTVEPIPVDTLDADHKLFDLDHVMMRHGSELFDLDQLEFAYQGSRTFTHIRCDVWAALRENWPQVGINTTVEAYYTEGNWTAEEGNSLEQHVLVGLWLRSVDTTDSYINEWITHVHNFIRESPDVAVFDIRSCYVAKQMKHFRFKLQGPFAELQKREQVVVRSVRQELAALMKVELIRLTDIKIYAGADDTTIVWMTLLEAPAVVGDALEPVIQVSMEDAFQKLQTWISDDPGPYITVTFTEGEKVFQVLKSTLLTDDDVYDPRKPQCAVTSGYTSGSMAAIAIIMLLLGGFAGVLITIFHNRKKRAAEIPYQVQD